MNICIICMAIINDRFGSHKAYLFQVWGDKLDFVNTSDGDKWVLYAGSNVVSCGDVSCLHANGRVGGVSEYEYVVRPL